MSKEEKKEKQRIGVVGQFVKKLFRAKQKDLILGLKAGLVKCSKSITTNFDWQGAPMEEPSAAVGGPKAMAIFSNSSLVSQIWTFLRYFELPARMVLVCKSWRVWAPKPTHRLLLRDLRLPRDISSVPQPLVKQLPTALKEASLRQDIPEDEKLVTKSPWYHSIYTRPPGWIGGAPTVSKASIFSTELLDLAFNPLLTDFDKSPRRNPLFFCVFSFFGM
jgi:hypothetical protein